MHPRVIERYAKSALGRDQYLDAAIFCLNGLCTSTRGLSNVRYH
ncbi:hypothetical protein [Vibrio phage J14]|nr:hypothetical protein [Vibrio phage J14]